MYKIRYYLGKKEKPTKALANSFNNYCSMIASTGQTPAHVPQPIQAD